jgi:hypoxanthine phosphoribosyltransferase
VCADATPLGPGGIAEVLLTADQIGERVRELAAAIERDVSPDRDVHLVGILTGAFVFMADLVRAMTARVTLDFMAVSSYGTGVLTSGEVRVLKDLDIGLAGRHVVIVEDIVDTGTTLAYLQEILRARGPRSLRTATLLSKPSRRRVPVTVEYVGFEIDDRFVVGYGLDQAHRFRNLPYVGIAREPSDLPGQ